MMNIRKSVIVTFVLFFYSCQQNEPLPSVLSLLTNNDEKHWRVTEIIDPEETYQFGRCTIDDIWVFKLFDEEKKQPSYRILDDFLTCQYSGNFNQYRSSLPIAHSGTWRMNNRSNRITFTYISEQDDFIFFFGEESDSVTFSNRSFEILDISNHELMLELTIEDSWGFNRDQIKINFRRL